MKTPVLFAFRKENFISWKKAKLTLKVLSSVRAVPTPPMASSAGGRTGTVSGRL